MIRFKSIDIFRGICMGWMFLGHLLEWWIKPEYLYINNFTHVILDSVGASGFLFISGVSVALSYQNRMMRVKQNELSYSQVRNSYFIRAFFLIIIALLYNLPIAIYLDNLASIWMWFVLLTAAVSLFMGWPFLEIKKSIRIISGILLWIFNIFIFDLLKTYKGYTNLFGIFYHLLYNEPQLDPILNFFPFFLFGTVLGDLISGSINNKTNSVNRIKIQKSLIKPIIIIGPILITFGILFNFPDFLNRGSFAWNTYSLGIEITLLIILLIFEIVIYIKVKKNYRLLFYFSYYSFTVYLTHHLLYFLFLEQLDYVSIWIVIFITFISYGLILKAIYRVFGSKASIKSLLAKLSSYLAERIEKRNKINHNL
jgi:uncharacterized membrane protein